MIKYASNAFLATKISFVNAIANLCEAVDADVREVALGMGYDQRIGFEFLHPGPGYGGSCFPKDTAALLHTARARGLRLLAARGRRRGEPAPARAHGREAARRRPAARSPASTVARLGPHVQGQHRRPARLARAGHRARLLEEGARVRAYDPAAGERGGGAGARARGRAPTPTTRGDGRDAARAAHRVGRVPLARLRPRSPTRWRAPRASSTPATCSTRRPCAGAASPTRASAADASRVVVTGGAGFLGSHLCDAPRARDWEVVGLDNLLTGRHGEPRAARRRRRVHVRRARRRRRHPRRRAGRRGAALREPREPARLPRAPDQDPEGRLARHAQHARSRAAPRARGSCSRRRARSTATRWCTRSPRATGATSTRSARAACTTRPSASPRRSRSRTTASTASTPHRAHLQHLRSAAAAGRRPGRVELPRAGDARASRSRSTATASRPVRSATSTTRCAGHPRVCSSPTTSAR